MQLCPFNATKIAIKTASLKDNKKPPRPLPWRETNCSKMKTNPAVRQTPR